MKTMAYNIDAMLGDASTIADQSLLDAIPDLARSLPLYRHLALTRDQSLKLDATNPAPPLDLLKIQAKGYFWQNPENTHKKAIAQACATNGVELWLTTDPMAVLKSEKVKTLLVSTALQILGPKGYLQKKWGRTVTPPWLDAAAIVVPHLEDRNALVDAYPQLQKLITVIYPAFEESVAPLDWAEQEQLKLRYSGGRDYFLYAGNLSSSMELIHLLKAYSLVKKWLMTGMPLILAGQPDDWTPTLEKMLLTYKYRSDVSVYTDLSQQDLKELVAGAYALVFPAATTAAAYPLQWAFSTGTPVIASESKAMTELARDAAQLSPAGDLDQLANAMMVLYKDEYLRTNLSSRGRERAATLNRNNSLQQFKVVIMGLMGDNG